MKAQEPKTVYIGGQAVMEGVMMRAPDCMGIAVRRACDKKIEVHSQEIVPPAKKYKILGVPVVRGVVAFISSLTTGMSTITKSAQMVGDEANFEEPSKFEKWVSKTFKVKEDDVIIFFAVALALVLALGLFFALPSLVGTGLNALIPNNAFLVNLLEGVFRILVFMAYIISITRIKEIKRVFMYHGAEHKTVYCNENNEELTVENCRKYPLMHPRCGTAFLLIVMLISIVIFSIAGIFGLDGNWLTRLLVRLAMLPIVAGVSYELLQYLGKRDNAFVRFLRWPGMQLQRLTVYEPTDDMIEVAIAAMKVAKKEWVEPVEELTEDETALEADDQPLQEVCDCAKEGCDSSEKTNEAI